MKFYEMEEGKVYTNNKVSGYVYKVEGEVIYTKPDSTGVWIRSVMEPLVMYKSDFKEIKEKKNGWERVEEDVDYYLIDAVGEIGIYGEDLTEYDDNLHKYCNYFSTVEKAEQIRDMNLLQRLMQKFADENNEGEIDWNDEKEVKISIEINHSYSSYEFFMTYTSENIGTTYFNSIAVAKRCIEEVIKPFYNK